MGNILMSFVWTELEIDFPGSRQTFLTNNATDIFFSLNIKRTCKFLGSKQIPICETRSLASKDPASTISLPYLLRSCRSWRPNGGAKGFARMSMSSTDIRNPDRKKQNRPPLIKVKRLPQFSKEFGDHKYLSSPIMRQ